MSTREEDARVAAVTYSQLLEEQRKAAEDPLRGAEEQADEFMGRQYVGSGESPFREVVSTATGDALLENRQAAALESIAASLQRLANPDAVVRSSPRTKGIWRSD